VVVSNNGDSGALRRARQAGVQALHLSSKTHEDPAALDAAIRGVLVARAREKEFVVETLAQIAEGEIRLGAGAG
jgi:folate-dependent phosphoribosylglycinamide formyltransferase PurN